MRKGVVEMIVRVAAAGVVANPGLAIHVRDVGVAVLVAVVAIRLDRMGRAGVRLGAAPGRRLVGSSTRGTGFPSPIVMLSEGWNEKEPAKWPMLSEWISSFPPDALEGEQRFFAALLPWAGHSNNIRYNPARTMQVAVW